MQSPIISKMTSTFAKETKNVSPLLSSEDDLNLDNLLDDLEEDVKDSSRQKTNNTKHGSSKEDTIYYN